MQVKLPHKNQNEIQTVLLRMSAWTLQKMLDACVFYMWGLYVIHSLPHFQMLAFEPDLTWTKMTYSRAFLSKKKKKKKETHYVSGIILLPLTNQILINTELRILLVHWQIWQCVSNLTVPLYKYASFVSRRVIYSSSYCSKLEELNSQHSKDLMWFSMQLQWSKNRHKSTIKVVHKKLL